MLFIWSCPKFCCGEWVKEAPNFKLTQVFYSAREITPVNSKQEFVSIYLPLIRLMCIQVF